MTQKWYVSSKLVLDKRRIKKDGTYPLKVRIILNGRTIDFSTGESILEKDWNQSAKSIKKSWKGNSARLTKKLKVQESKFLEALNELLDQGRISENMKRSEIKALIVKPQTTTNTFVFINQIIANLSAQQKIGTAKYYRQISASIKRFVKFYRNRDEDFPLEEIDYNWLKKYELWYYSHNTAENSVNGLAVYMRGIRAIINKAKKSKLLSYDHVPFYYYKIKTRKTSKRVIPKKDLEKLKQATPNNGWQKRSIDYFFASYFMWGISFIDLAYLKWEDISQNRITYVRRKTNKEYSFGVIKPLQIILDKYRLVSGNNDYIFGILDTEMSEAQKYRSAKNALKRYNKALKALSEQEGISPPITSYWARHTFATTLKRAGIPVAQIKEMLGHEKESTTQTYLDKFDESALDEINAAIIGDRS